MSTLPQPPNPNPTGPASDPLLELIHAGWASQAIGTAVELGLPDLLAAGPADATTLAAAAGCDADALGRLLDALATLGLVEPDGAGDADPAGDISKVSDDDNGPSAPGPRYALTPAGHRLRPDAPDGVAAQARWFARHSWSLLDGLGASVRSGRSERARRGGSAGYGHIAGDAAAAAVFNRAMHELTRLIAPAVAAAVDWRGTAVLLDVGGGHGTLLATCLQACRAVNPAARGRLFELAHALPGARALLAAAGLADCTAVEAGDFFAHIPPGADRLLLKAVLHNWDDARALQILRACHAALNPGGRLLVVERLRPDRPAPRPVDRAVLRSDLNMLVALGGRERRRGEFTALLQAAGFGAPQVQPVGEGFVVLEAARQGD